MLLRPKMGGKLSDKQAKYIGIIYRNILKLETLVGDVLGVYKLDMGRFNFSKLNTEVQSLPTSLQSSAILYTLSKLGFDKFFEGLSTEDIWIS